LNRRKKGKAKERHPREPLPKIDFTGKEVIGKCPKCGGKVFDTEAGYLCEKSQSDSRACKFKISKEICSSPSSRRRRRRSSPRRRVIYLIKFISKAGKPFPAYLVMDAKGKITSISRRAKNDAD